jgi:hypothetical protein
MLLLKTNPPQRALIWMAFLGLSVGLSVGVHASGVDFQRDIQPFFAEHCLECHGADKTKGGLALTSKKAALKTLESGAPGITPGSPHLSAIIARLETDDKEDIMPPLKKNKRPKSQDIAKLKQWIAEGAEWSMHWAYAPIQKQPANPKANPAEQIDAIIRERLTKEGIKPAPQAPKETLLKRVYYDLLGLPPTADEAAGFLNDQAPEAYEKLIERALASPHFGERWGRHWLDQARYADSDGYEKDSARPDAWRYRDWVIQSVNEDLPLDRFTIEQLAGDLLEKPNPDQVLATAFHRQTLTNREGGVDQEQYRVEAVFDRTETTGSVWLGLTVGCARCHSHKYDQISQQEYYQLFAFFNNADESIAKVGISKAELDAYEKNNAAHLATLDAHRKNYQRARAPLALKLSDWERDTQQRLKALEGSASTTVGLVPVKIASEQNAKFEQLPDRSTIVTGNTPPTDSYSIEFALPEGVISGFKLEVLPDPSLPSNGPGRSKNGNFVLTGFGVHPKGSVGAEAFPLHSPKSTFTQTGFPSEATIDADTQTGWAIAGGTAKPQSIVFQLIHPIDAHAPRHVVIKLEQQNTKSTQHLIGRFRLHALVGETAESLVTADLKRFVATGSEKWTNEQKETVIDWLSHFDPNADAARRTLDRVEASGPRPPVMDARVLNERQRARETRIFHRGEFLSPGEQVSAGTPAILPALVPRKPGSPDRLDLAEWLTSPENPITARVMANQIWMRLFGEGLVRSAGDFGVRGDAPTHLELLDFLASRLRDHGWSRKDLIRQIVLSKTYQQSSAVRRELADIDPLNRLVSRQNRLRVEAEVVRDLHLAVAGLLSRKVGGPSVFPPMPPEVASLSYANNFRWNESKGEDRYRRGMYTFFKRTAPYPDLVTFDCPDANVASIRRTVSNTPLQALTTLNSATFSEAAQTLAKKITEKNGATKGPDSERIEALFKTCLFRQPDPTESKALLALLADSKATFAQNPKEAEKFASNVELAAWTSVARIVLNTDEFITRD